MKAPIYNLDLCKEVYKNIFILDIDISKINDREDMWPILVHRDIKLQYLKNLVEDFNQVVSSSFPSPEMIHKRFSEENYVIWVKPEVNVSTYLNKSLKEIDSMSVHGISLIEYYLLCIFVRSHRSLILDTETRTLCSGSRYLNNESINMFFNGIIDSSPHEKRDQGVINMGTREVFHYTKI